MIIRTDNLDGEGHEFDYYDSHPDEDPFAPKPTCEVCGGSGVMRGPDDRAYNCPACDGTGCEK